MADPGYAVMDGMIASLASLGAKLVDDARPELAEILRSDIVATIHAGTDAYGDPWRETQDGDKPLQGTPENLKVGVRGTRIVATLDGYHARHHRGYAQGGVQRAILPRQGLLPPKTVARWQAALRRRFEAATAKGAA